MALPLYGLETLLTFAVHSMPVHVTQAFRLRRRLNGLQRGAAVTMGSAETTALFRNTSNIAAQLKSRRLSIQRMIHLLRRNLSTFRQSSVTLE
jgi:hypothetical protein